jgi:hypothetical protein
VVVLSSWFGFMFWVPLQVFIKYYILPNLKPNCYRV